MFLIHTSSYGMSITRLKTCQHFHFYIFFLKYFFLFSAKRISATPAELQKLAKKNSKIFLKHKLEGPKQKPVVNVTGKCL